MNSITNIKKSKDIIFYKNFEMNITEIFNILVKPNIGHTVTIKNAKEGWFGKEFIHNEDVTGILEECNTYKDHVGKGPMSFYLKVNGDIYDVTDRDFYFST